LPDTLSAYAKIEIKCKKCDNIWTTTVNSHTSWRGCPSCGAQKKSSWSLSRLLTESDRIYGKWFTYEDTAPESISYANSIVNITCTKCHFKFPMQIDEHIYHKRGCKSCRKIEREK
jgi:transcription elongation factor Elf1